MAGALNTWLTDVIVRQKHYDSSM